MLVTEATLSSRALIQLKGGNLVENAFLEGFFSRLSSPLGCIMRPHALYYPSKHLKNFQVLKDQTLGIVVVV